MLVLQIIGGLLILVVLVVLHELGHAIVARRNGVVVEEFGIGFPPRAWGKKLKSGLIFSLNWLPLGGFVKLQGENDSASKKGDYGAATLWVKTKILFAGVVINWLFAALLLTVLAATGMPHALENQFTVASDTHINKQPVEIASLLKDYPAEKAGFQVGDKILSFAGESLSTSQAVIDATKQHRGETITVVIERGGKTIDKEVTLKDSKAGSLFGASLGQRETYRSTWSAPIVGVVTTAQFTGATFQSLGQLLANLGAGIALQINPDTRQQANDSLKQVGDSVAGPVGILGTLFPSAEEAGLTSLVFLTAIISLTLAVMNVLPIPALDGGRWFVTVLFRLLKKPLTKEREEKIQATGFLVLMALIIIITVGDIVKLF